MSAPKLAEPTPTQADSDARVASLREELASAEAENAANHRVDADTRAEFEAAKVEVARLEAQPLAAKGPARAAQSTAIATQRAEVDGCERAHMSAGVSLNQSMKKVGELAKQMQDAEAYSAHPRVVEIDSASGKMLGAFLERMTHLVIEARGLEARASKFKPMQRGYAGFEILNLSTEPADLLRGLAGLSCVKELTEKQRLARIHADRLREGIAILARKLDEQKEMLAVAQKHLRAEKVLFTEKRGSMKNDNGGQLHTAQLNSIEARVDSAKQLVSERHKQVERAQKLLDAEVAWAAAQRGGES